MAGAEDDDENVIIEKDDEGNTWVIDLNSAVVMRKPAGANAELAVVGRWIDGAVVLNEELRGATKGNRCVSRGRERREAPRQGNAAGR